MKKYLKDGDATATDYEDFAPHMKEIYKPPDLARASLLSLTRTKQLSGRNGDPFSIPVRTPIREGLPPPPC